MTAQAEQTSPQPTEAAILAGVELNTEVDPASLIYDEQFGGLVQPQQDGSMRLLMFRAHGSHTAAPSAPTPPANERKRFIPRVNDTFYGTGLYLGNTPQAVSVYGLKPGREVSAFLTPPIRLDNVADRRGSFRQAIAAPQRLGRHAVKAVTMRLTKDKAVSAIDADYGSSALAIQDMGPDAYTAQRALARRHDHPVKPAWYVWRSAPGELEKVGTVPTLPITPNRLGRKVLGLQKK